MPNLRKALNPKVRQADAFDLVDQAEFTKVKVEVGTGKSDFLEKLAAH